MSERLPPRMWTNPRLLAVMTGWCVGVAMLVLPQVAVGVTPAAAPSGVVVAAVSAPHAAASTSAREQSRGSARGWRITYSTAFARHFNDRDWTWVRHQFKVADRKQLMRDARRARQFGKARASHCAPRQGADDAWCEFWNRNYYALLFDRTPRGIRVIQIFLQD